jgi:hypothetical protein
MTRAGYLKDVNAVLEQRGGEEMTSTVLFFPLTSTVSSLRCNSTSMLIYSPSRQLLRHHSCSPRPYRWSHHFFRRLSTTAEAGMGNQAND